MNNPVATTILKRFLDLGWTLLVVGWLAVVAFDAFASEPAKEEVKRDRGPAPGPARLSGLTCLGKLRVRSSDEIGGSRWGVSCHWIADPHELTTDQRVELLARLGAKWALLVPDWDQIETRRGVYDFNRPSHRFEEAVQGMVRRKIHPIIQIYGGNRLYMPRALDPNNRQLADAAALLDDPEARQAWHRFLEALVTRYREHVKVWEIWNEPNGPWFWTRQATVAQYGRMVKEAAGIVRRVDPGATILAGSTAMIPVDYFRGLLDSEGASAFDYCSMHPYGAVPEQTAGAVRQLQQLLSARGKSAVLWQTECGLPSSSDTAGWGFGGPWNETKHAKWVLRRLLVDAALTMRVSIYFILEDYPGLIEAGPNRGKQGINRKGLYFAQSWEPKPAAYAFQNLASLIDDRLTPKPVPTAIQILDPGPLAGANAESVHVYTWTEKQTGSPVIAYWLAVPMQTESAAGKVRITLSEAAIPQPVLVDLLDGRVYSVEPVIRNVGGTVFENLPVADSPLVLCSRTLVELKP